MAGWLAISELPVRGTGQRTVSLNLASWNQLNGWLRQVEALEP